MIRIKLGLGGAFLARESTAVAQRHSENRRREKLATAKRLLV
jgi:hypothetical protein